MPDPRSETSTPVLEVRDVDVRLPARGGSLLSRDRVHALTGVSLAVAPGETVGVVGESGCGKSTLARVLIGLQRPTSGTVAVNGTDLAGLTGRARSRVIGSTVGMVFQDSSTALNPRLPVRAILRDPLDVHRHGNAAARQERVRELMSLVGLPASVADLLPSQLSGGQRQRVAIARALALEPAVLVADEPTSALDVSVRAQILNLLLDLNERLGLATVFVSHDIATVRRMADRIITMYLGRIVEVTPAPAVITGTRHPYSRALLSATPSLLHDTTPITLEGPVPSAVHPPSGCPFRTRCWRASEQCAVTMPPFEADLSTPLHEFRCYHPVLDDADLATPISQEKM
ncbi:oligopeptide/dipeptide ABC transporter ATP-binding protein [Nocardioides sp. DS6]|uniref:Oligopeptide/dipeptide ABC transporter ATP-binding protein n=1 Tax=Nocardioides eburneus TaxID=3231482 RepID=A0ABV3T0F1_9ACTN